MKTFSVHGCSSTDNSTEGLLILRDFDFDQGTNDVPRIYGRNSPGCEIVGGRMSCLFADVGSMVGNVQRPLSVELPHLHLHIFIAMLSFAGPHMIHIALSVPTFRTISICYVQYHLINTRFSRLAQGCVRRNRGSRWRFSLLLL